MMLIAAGLVAGGCSRSDQKAKLDVPEDQLAATVEDWQLTRAELEDFLRRLPDPQRRRFDTPQGRADLALRLMQEELSYREAQRLNLDQARECGQQYIANTGVVIHPVALPSLPRLYAYQKYILFLCDRLHALFPLRIHRE
jgi:hypothetical protein